LLIRDRAERCVFASALVFPRPPLARRGRALKAFGGIGADPRGRTMASVWP
jgi:hypothetical protein